MKTDVHDTLKALRGERTRLDLAIAALEALHVPAPIAVAPKRPLRRAARSRYRIDDATKTRVFDAMANAENRSEMARTLSRETGISAATIQTGWRRYAPAQEAMVATA